MKRADVQRAPDGDATLDDDGVGITLTDREIVQHHQPLSTIDRWTRRTPSVTGSSVGAARRSASARDTRCPSWYSWAITASQRWHRRAFIQREGSVGLGCETSSTGFS